MTDRPIIFSGPMIRALLDGQKTQTRRVLKATQPYSQGDDIDAAVVTDFIAPKIRRGDRFYVRESVIRQETDQGVGFQTYAADGAEVWPLTKWYHQRKSIPSIHMPRWASRLTLTVTDVRVQRLQDISAEDCVREGIKISDGALFRDGYMLANRKDFRHLWNSLHGPEAWDANPWIAAYTFTVQRGNIDAIRALPTPTSADLVARLKETE